MARPSPIRRASGIRIVTRTQATRRSSIDLAPTWAKTTIENSKNAASLLMIEGNYEYFKILDNNLAART